MICVVAVPAVGAICRQWVCSPSVGFTCFSLPAHLADFSFQAVKEKMLAQILLVAGNTALSKSSSHLQYCLFEDLCKHV